MRGKFNMKIMLSSIAVVFICAVGALADAPAMSPAWVLCDTTYVNFGSVDNSLEVNHTVQVRNPGQEDLVVRLMDPLPPGESCRCKRRLISEVVLPPGGEGKMKITLPLKTYHGMVKKNYELESADTNRPVIKLLLEGRAFPGVIILPSEANFKGVALDAVAEQELDIRFGAADPVDVLQVKSSAPFVAGTLIVMPDQTNHYGLLVQTRPPLPLGLTNAELRLFTDYGPLPVVTVPVTITAELPIEARPPTLEIKAGTIHAEVFLSSRHRDFTIRSIESPVQWLRAELAGVGVNLYRIELTGEGPLADLQGKSLKVNTSLANQPVVEVPIRVISEP